MIGNYLISPDGFPVVVPCHTLLSMPQKRNTYCLETRNKTANKATATIFQDSAPDLIKSIYSSKPFRFGVKKREYGWEKAAGFLCQKAYHQHNIYHQNFPFSFLLPHRKHGKTEAKEIGFLSFSTCKTINYFFVPKKNERNKINGFLPHRIIRMVLLAAYTESGSTGIMLWILSIYIVYI